MAVDEPTLTVLGAGMGDGTIIDMPTGVAVIRCEGVAGDTSGDCTETAPSGTPFALSASAAAFSIFDHWSGCKTVSGDIDEVCEIALDSDSTVTAIFITAVDAIQVLRDSVNDLAGLSDNQKSDLTDPLDNIEKLLTDANSNNDVAACNKLGLSRIVVAAPSETPSPLEMATLHGRGQPVELALEGRLPGELRHPGRK